MSDLIQVGDKVVYSRLDFINKDIFMHPYRVKDSEWVVEAVIIGSRVKIAGYQGLISSKYLKVVSVNLENE